MTQHAQRCGVVILLALAMMPSGTLPAGAQTSSDPDSGRITASASVDVLNAYSFRGIRQDDDTGVVVWPRLFGHWKRLFPHLRRISRPAAGPARFQETTLPTLARSMAVLTSMDMDAGAVARLAAIGPAVDAIGPLEVARSSVR